MSDSYRLHHSDVSWGQSSGMSKVKFCEVNNLSLIQVMVWARPADAESQEINANFKIL